MVCAALLLAVPLGAARAATPEEAAVLALINQQRAGAGCAPLTAQPQLRAAAAAHSRDMAERNYFGHKSPDGSTPRKRVRQQGYAGGRLAENIAAGQSTPEKVVAAWMASPQHRANILNCRFRETGIGRAFQADDAPIGGNSFALRTYWTQVFVIR